MKAPKSGTLVALVCSILFCFAACKSKQIGISELAKIENITKKVESKHYEFIPRSANPMGYRQVNLDHSYSLRIAGDTLIAHLPYFGRSYTASIDPNQIGYNFTSTDFDYKVETKKDRWDIQIKIADTSNKGILLFLSIGDTGYADLRIQDTNRQSISYYGSINDD